jgi:hypothetical protein
MTSFLTNILSIHFLKDVYDETDIRQYMLDIGIINYNFVDANGWFIIKINNMLRLENETRVRHNHDLSIMYEYEMVENI